MDQPGGFGAVPGVPPPGAPLSPDGRAWWDGARWLPLPPPMAPAAPAPAAAPPPPAVFGQVPLFFQPYPQPPDPAARPRKRGLFAVIAVVVLVAVGGTATYLITRPAPIPTGHTFTDPGGHFSAAFPTPPLSTTQTLTEDGADFTITEYEAQVSASDGYLVGYVVYPASFDAGDSYGVLGAAIQGALSAAGGTLMSRTDGTYHGLPSTDFLLAASGYYVEMRLVLDGESLFEIGIQSTQDPPPGFTGFANSLVILSP